MNRSIPEPPVEKLFVFSHLGMGDQIICNGLARKLADTGEPICWIAKSSYINAVRYMFRDVPNIQVLGTLSDGEVKTRWIPNVPKKLCLGCFSPGGFNPKRFDSEFYRQAGFPFSMRWDRFKLPEQLFKVNPVPGEFALIHEDYPRRFLITDSRLPKNLKIVKIDGRPSFWDWLPEILAAKELHVIDSSYLNLIESLWHIGAIKAKMVWHFYARRYDKYGGDIPTVRGPWEILR